MPDAPTPPCNITQYTDRPRRCVLPPPAGTVVRFKTKAQGWIVGGYFSGRYWDATSNGAWGDRFVTEWVPVLVLPDTEDTVTALVAEVVRQAATSLGVPRTAGQEADQADHVRQHLETVWAALRKVAV